MKKNNMNSLRGAIYAILGLIAYRLFKESIFFYILIMLISIILIYELYRINKNKICTHEENIILIVGIVFTFFIAFYKALDDKLINLNIDIKVFVLAVFILITIIIVSVIINVYKRKSKEEARRVSVIACITIILISIFVVLAIAWT